MLPIVASLSTSPDVAPPAAPKRYKAFISYSHSADARFAKLLQSSLERFGKPWHSIRAFRTFRDQTNLSITPELWPEIEAALSQAEYLLFLASPVATRSDWVDRELRHWLSHYGPSKLLIVLTHGAIAWDKRAGDFDWAATTSIPEALKGRFPAPPLHVDCTRFSDGRVTLDDPEFLDHVATVAARLHGKEKDEIFGEHIRQHRKTMRIVWTVGVALAVLSLGLAATLVKENRERMRAERQTRIATAQRLAAQSQMLAATALYPQTAILLAAEALRVTEDAGEARVPAAEEALRATLATVGGIGLGAATTERPFAGFTRDGRWLAIKTGPRTVSLRDVSNDPGGPPVVVESDTDLGFIGLTKNSDWLVSSAEKEMRLWPLFTGDPSKGRVDIHAGDTPFSTFALPRNGQFVVAATQRGQLLIWRLERSGVKPMPAVQAHTAAIESIIISDDSRWLVTGSADKTAKVWDLNSPDPFACPVVLGGHARAVSLLAISPDGMRIVTAGSHNVPRLWTMTGRKPRAVTLDKIEDTIAWMHLSPDGRWLVSGGRWAYASLCDLASADPSASCTILPSEGGPVAIASFAPDSRRIVTIAGPAAEEHAISMTPEPRARVWDITGKTPSPSLVLDGHTDVILDAEFVGRGAYFATASFDNTIRIWNLSSEASPQAVHVIRGHQGPIIRMAASADGRWIATVAFDNTARLISLTDVVPTASPVRMHMAKPAALHSSADGKVTYVGRSAVARWDLRGDRPSARADYTALGDEAPEPQVSALSRNGRWLALGFGEESDTLLLVLDLADGIEKAKSFEAGRGRKFDGVTLTDRWVLLTSRHEGGGRDVDLWDLGGANPQKVSAGVVGIEPPVAALAVTHETSLLAAAGMDRTVRLVSMPADSSARITSVGSATGDIGSLFFTPDRRWLVARGSGSADRTLMLWKIADGRLSGAPVTLAGHEKAIEHFAFSPDGRWISSGAFGDAMLVWKLDQPDPSQPYFRLPIRASISMASEFSADGKWLVTTSYEGETQLWPFETQLRPFVTQLWPFVTQLWPFETRLWPFSGGAAAIEGPLTLRGHERPLVRTAISPDGRWLVTADGDLDTEDDPARTVRIWDLRVADPTTSAVVLPRSEMPRGATRLTISADSRWLVTSGIDGVRLWPLGTRQLMATARRTAGRDFNDDEKRVYGVPVPR